LLRRPARTVGDGEPDATRRAPSPLRGLRRIISAERFQLGIFGSGFADPIVALIATYLKPAGILLYELQEIELRAGELEVVRLADDEDLYHTEAAKRMGVSRQTFDRIVRGARRKIAAALVHGQALRIGLARATSRRRRAAP
jgi:predicted DNA-binding protein (UPF0251 family)